MGEKDIAEKYLESYNDVFADLVNVLLFQGKRVMRANQLTENKLRAVYKAGDKIHEEERDISKYWKKRQVCIAVCGIENQTEVDQMMPLRIIGYDGASYREQLLKGRSKHIYPVVTLVLYFGTDHPWEKPLKLSDCLEIPQELRPHFSDYQIRVYSIAFLTKETVRLFQSDFRIVADYFYQKRMNKNYIPSKRTIRHVDAVLKLMAVMTDDHRYEEVQREGEIHTMCDVLDKIEERGIAIGEQRGITIGEQRGIAIGEQRGITIGESRMIVKMYQNGLSKEQIADVTDKKIQEIELLLKND